MMSVMLGLSFAAFGVLALAAMLATWRRYAPHIAGLRRALRQPPATREIRLTVLEHALVRLRPNRGPMRHQHRPKPIKHRLHGARPRRTAANP